MRYLVVNGDDLGLSPGVNRGIVEAHRRGILTSASLIVNLPWSEDAVERIREAPGLSLGLHVNLTSGEEVGEQLLAQMARFRQLVGKLPAHIDSHHNDHQRPELLSHFSALAAGCRALLRGHSLIRSVTSFYGQWGGVSHPEQVDVAGLTRLLEDDIGEGVTELACHPGYADAQLRSSYAIEREIELATLCDRRIPPTLRRLGIELIGSWDAARMFDNPGARERMERSSAQP